MCKLEMAFLVMKCIKSERNRIVGFFVILEHAVLAGTVIFGVANIKDFSNVSKKKSL